MNKLITAGLLVAGLLAHGVVAAQTTYLDGVSPLAAPGVFNFGTFRPGYIGATLGSDDLGTEGTKLDGFAVSFDDVAAVTANGRTGSVNSDPFNLLVWSFGSAFDSVRLYNQPELLAAAAMTNAQLAEYMQFSVWGCNFSASVDCKDKAEWTLLSDVTNLDPFAFTGTAPTTVYRGGSAELGAVNAYTQDYTYATAYNFYGVRASTLAIQYGIKAPELDAMAAFNRRGFDAPVPEPATLALMGLGLSALAFLRRRRR